MKKVFIVLPMIAIALVLSGCSEGSTSQSSGNVEQNNTEENQQKLIKNQAPPSLDWSLERDNIIKRINLWNDPNKISYIYLINYGKVMAFYTIKGKVSSVNSQVTNSEQLQAKCVNPDGTYSTNEGCGRYGQTRVSGNIPSPSEDGSYGTNGDAIFFFTTEGAYVEAKSDYVLSDQPLKISTPIELTREVK